MFCKLGNTMYIMQNKFNYTYKVCLCLELNGQMLTTKYIALRINDNLNCLFTFKICKELNFPRSKNIMQRAFLLTTQRVYIFLLCKELILNPKNAKSVFFYYAYFFKS